MDMNALESTDVRRSYGTRQVLDGFSLSLKSGEFVALMGPSGSGKSTFLHVAAGLLSTDAGTIRIGGADITRMSDAAVTKFRRRHVGVVFQAFNLLAEKTVRENILLPLTLDGVRVRRDDFPWMDTLCVRLNLTALLDKRPEQLSGGEQQRVALARALVTEPELILADEPTGNLDAWTGAEILKMLLELATDSKAFSLVMVTHSPEAAAICDRTLTLEDGVLK